MVDPVKKISKLYNAIGLDFGEETRRFIEKHTKNEVDKPWSVTRDSKKRLLYWTKKLPWNQVEEVQSQCASSMFSHGYKLINSLIDLKGTDVIEDLPGSL